MILNRLQTYQRWFLAHLMVFVLVVTGTVPREVILPWTVILLGWFIRGKLTELILFFVSSVPLFIALPLGRFGDNFNLWRILALVLVLRWALQYRRRDIIEYWRRPLKTKTTSVLFFLLLGLAVLSLWHAPYLAAGLRRMVLIGNGLMVGVVIYQLLASRRMGLTDTIQAIGIGSIAPLVIAYIQLASTYWWDIYQFIRVWGEGVQLRQFGATWSHIATQLGNTWFAYYGEQLSLRIFSLFTDSHTFPIYMILALPALMAVALRNIDFENTLSRILRQRARMTIIVIPIILLVVILSGTRGIWLAGIATISIALTLVLALHIHRQGARYPAMFKRILIYLTILITTFVPLFLVAYPIVTSPQFLLDKSDDQLFARRLRSVIDFGETSNAQRLAIWRSSWNSIQRHPFLGVGIGNFPVVLDQNIQLSKAGSSAHNFYLHIAAEIGVVGLALVLALIWRLLTTAWDVARESHSSPELIIYTLGCFVAFVWVFLYVMTDVALFDERALLQMTIVGSSVFGLARIKSDTHA